MCGLVGMVAGRDVAADIYDALTMLQHRGQDAAGIMTCDDGKLMQRKGEGLVRDVFRTSHMEQLLGRFGIGHVRYPTQGSSGTALAQPFYVNSPYGIALAHNGNLTNSKFLSDELFKSDLRHLNTDSDSEVLLNVFAHELNRLGKLEPEPADIFQAIRRLHKRCEGGYAAVALIAGFGLVAFRDPFGIRPLVVGQRVANGKHPEYMVASESVALDVAGYDLIGDVQPGEAICVTQSGQLHRQQCADKPKLMPCIFEHVYFARPDSLIDSISVYKTRMRQGAALAKKILRELPEHDIDVVIPIPDTSRVAGQSLAYELGVKFREGFMKNRYIGRTFIMPGQSERKKSVRQKLNPVPLEFQDKAVLLVDDSIVRGTTCGQIIQMAREAGAKQVYFASAAPPVRYPNVYGIDMPAANELIAHGRSVEEVRQEIGADWLVYQDLEDLIECSREGNPDVNGFESSVFDGKYLAGNIDDTYLQSIEAARSEGAKGGRPLGVSDGAVVGLHNDG
ncbi:MAG: amidophosphoribosyltransferase [Luminiphilus sp.]|jgi:amidophosphoribosyltransferase|nr:amidophosphoribosyltransferase [Luminiphilus sp.]